MFDAFDAVQEGWSIVWIDRQTGRLEDGWDRVDGCTPEASLEGTRWDETRRDGAGGREFYFALVALGLYLACTAHGKKERYGRAGRCGSRVRGLADRGLSG